MKKELCGFKRYLYTFNLNEKEKFEKMFNNAQKRGTVKQIFINNGYGFELQEWRIKMWIKERAQNPPLLLDRFLAISIIEIHAKILFITIVKIPIQILIF